ncbi:MAG: isochorismatase family protein [Verrucomicrobiota bacterium]
MGWRIDAENAAVLLVDVQEKLLPVIADADQIKRRQLLLLQGAKALGLPIYVTEQYPKGLGNTVSDLIKGIEPEKIFEKTSFSAAPAVSDLDARHWIVAGIESHICVRQTVYDLQAAGRTAVIMADACGSRNSLDHQIAMQELQADRILVGSVESFLFEILGDADHKEFKTISNLVKDA